MQFLRRSSRSAVGATLLELTIVLVIIALLTLIQTQRGLDTMEHTRQQVAHLQPGFAARSSGHYQPVPGTFPTAERTWGADLQRNLQNLENKAQVLLNQSTDWARNLPPVDFSPPLREGSTPHVCIGQFCV